MEINPPVVKELRINNLGDISIIPPAEIIPPTTIGDLPFGFVPIIELPCVVARDKKTGTGDEIFNVDPKNNFVICDFASVTYVPPDSNSFEQDLSEVEPDVIPPEANTQLLNSLGDQRQEVKKKNGTEDKKEKKEVKQKSLLDLEIPTSEVNTGLLTEQLPCPPPDNKYPIGALGKYGTARVRGFQLNAVDGTCETLWEPLGKLEVLNNYSPPPALVTSTFTVALFGASAALFASPLTKLITKTLKPISKKLVKAVKAKLGKSEKVLSTAERMKAQREKTMVSRMWSSLRK